MALVAAWTVSPASAVTFGGVGQVVPGPAQVVAGVSLLSGVSCAGATTCEAVGSVSAGSVSGGQGVVAPITNGVAGDVTATADVGLVSVSCASPTTCEAVGQVAPPAHPNLFGPPPLVSVGVVVAITNGAFGIPQMVPTTGRLLSVSCPTVVVCEAVGINDAGDAVTVAIADGVPGPVFTSPGSELIGVSCPGENVCEAVGASFVTGDSGAQVVPILAGVPGTAQVVPGTFEFYGVSCPNLVACEAAGWGNAGAGTTGGVVAPIVNGSVGAAQAAPGTDIFFAVSCSSPARCLAIGPTGGASESVLVPISDGTPGAAQVLGAAKLADVACPSPTICEGVGANALGEGVVVTIANGVVNVSPQGAQAFGSSSPAFSTTSSPPTGDTFSGTLTCTSVGDPAAAISSALPAGTYILNGSGCSGLTLIGPTAPDYLIAYTDGTFTVDHAPVTTTTVAAPPATAPPPPQLPLTGEPTAIPLVAAATLLAVGLGAHMIRRRSV